MDQKVIDFLTSERVGSLAIVMPDGTSNAAAMHFVYSDGVIYFSTHVNSKKVEGLTTAKASVTFGFSEKDWITLQMNGILEKTTSAKDLILAKYPENAKHMDETVVFLKFTPTWWRYTDFKTNPPTFIENK